MLTRRCLVLVASYALVSAAPLCAADPATTAPAATADDAAKKTAEKAADDSYKPPFPERDELFHPPNNKRPVTRQENTSDVALKGFLNVDGQKVLLAVDGKVKPLAVGESTAGIEVVVINPPKVTLQRGRSRWTETLFEIRSMTRLQPPVESADAGSAPTDASDVSTVEPSAVEPSAVAPDAVENNTVDPSTVQPAVVDPDADPPSTTTPSEVPASDAEVTPSEDASDAK